MTTSLLIFNQYLSLGKRLPVTLTLLLLGMIPLTSYANGGGSCDEITVTPGNGRVTLSGIPDNANQVLLFDDKWHQVALCTYCGETQTFLVTEEGKYMVLVKLYDGTEISTVESCQKLHKVEISFNGSGLDEEEEKFNNSTTRLTTDDLAFDDVEVFPNPAANSFKVAIGKEYVGQSGSLQLFNQMGQLAKTVALDEIHPGPVEVSVENVPQGVYYLMVYANGKRVKVKKVNIERF